MATPHVVMVHGSWHGPWCWDRLRAELARRGVTSSAVALPSVGDPATWGDLAADARAVADAAGAVDGPVAVLAHSYGGAVATEADWPANVVRLILLAAFVPDLGQRLIDAFPPGPLPPYVELNSMVSRAVPELAAEFFYNTCAAEDARAAIARLLPQNPACPATPVTRTAWRSLPSAYIRTLQDRILPPPFQQQFADHCGDVAEIDSDHSPFLCQPSVLADRVTGLL